MKSNYRNRTLNWIMKIIPLTISIFIITLGAGNIVLADDKGSSGPPSTSNSSKLKQSGVKVFSSTVANSDGSYTYTQIVDENSTAPYYRPPSSGGGFEIYSWYNQDYGWMHDFNEWNNPKLAIISATMTIRGWDVDSEVYHGQDGEYDGVSVDGAMLNPGYLQGNSGEWSETDFSIPINSITDDGKINVWLNIDMNHNYDNWATTLDKSTLIIKYRLDGNAPPYKPELSISPYGPVDGVSDLIVNVTGPNPKDPDNDTVNYNYRWFVDVGNGYFVDDEFAGRNNHTGNTVPAADTKLGDKWRVQVTPADEHGAVGTFNTATWEVKSNSAPIIKAKSQSITVNEGSQATNSGTWVDENINDTVNLTASVGNIVKNTDGTWNWTFVAIDGTSSQVVTISASDGIITSEVKFNLVINNVVPTVGAILGADGVIKIGSAINVSADFSDLGVLDTHTAEWNFGDGVIIKGSINEKNGSGSTSATHVYKEPGEYSITLKVIDKDGGVGISATKHIVIKKKDIESITLNKAMSTLNPGDEDILIATITPTDATNKQVTWSSSNTAVATVDADGKVKAVGIGTATITVTTVDGGKTATCSITVTNPVVNVTSISINKTETKLTAGHTETLIATITPTNATNKQVTWSSSNTAVATVDAAGKVKAVGAGTATITVTTADGGKTATCKVTVIKSSSPTLPKTGSVIDNEALTLIGVILLVIGVIVIKYKKREV